MAPSEENSQYLKSRYHIMFQPGHTHAEHQNKSQRHSYLTSTGQDEFSMVVRVVVARVDATKIYTIVDYK